MKNEPIKSKYINRVHVTQHTHPLSFSLRQDWFSILPHEIALIILSELEVPDLKQLALVSRRWYNLYKGKNCLPITAM